MTANLNSLRHIAIVMDGNGRWAQAQGLMRFEGHRAGAKAAKRIIEYAAQQQLECLSLFAFSSENWQRPKPEVGFLFNLLRKTLDNQLQELHQNNIKLVFSGSRAELPRQLSAVLVKAETLTAQNSGMILNIALNYGGRWDILEATKKLAQQYASQEIKFDEINETNFNQALSLPELPAPDLFIRSSNEHRISNFFLWQLAYTELYFCEVLWPDFSVEHFKTAVQWYQSRQRRFGNISQAPEPLTPTT